MQHEHLDKLNAAIFTALNEGNPVNEISDAAYHLGFTAKPCKSVQRIIELTCWVFFDMASNSMAGRCACGGFW